MTGGHTNVSTCIDSLGGQLHTSDCSRTESPRWTLTCSSAKGNTPETRQTRYMDNKETTSGRKIYRLEKRRGWTRPGKLDAAKQPLGASEYEKMSQTELPTWVHSRDTERGVHAPGENETGVPLAVPSPPRAKPSPPREKKSDHPPVARHRVRLLREKIRGEKR